MRRSGHRQGRESLPLTNEPNNIAMPDTGSVYEAFDAIPLSEIPRKRSVSTAAIRSHDEAMPQEGPIGEPLYNVVSVEDIPPNGGYGWICTACVFMINAHTWGTNAVSLSLVSFAVFQLTFHRLGLSFLPSILRIRPFQMRHFSSTL